MSLSRTKPLAILTTPPGPKRVVEGKPIEFPVTNRVVTEKLASATMGWVTP